MDITAARVAEIAVQLSQDRLHELVLCAEELHQEQQSAAGRLQQRPGGPATLVG